MSIIYISIIGAIIIVAGLYSVVWGKAKDYPIFTPPSAATKQLPISSSLHE